MIFGQPYHVLVCPDCNESWEFPGDLENVCRATHTCKGGRR